jgi:hypothetical protein
MATGVDNELQIGLDHPVFGNLPLIGLGLPDVGATLRDVCLQSHWLSTMTNGGASTRKARPCGSRSTGFPGPGPAGSPLKTAARNATLSLGVKASRTPGVGAECRRR